VNLDQLCDILGAKKRLAARLLGKGQAANEFVADQRR